MGLDVHGLMQWGDMEHGECILCGSCVDGCNKRAIRFTFPAGRPAQKARAKNAITPEAKCTRGTSPESHHTTLGSE
jgi:ferredoxin